ncbi:UNVERIFIED_CONTAM: hypothetical protein PYX00_008131 [Menopon gallinae]|uniref:Guanosine-3',5'-bis(diphosphate) 3'-pyrophosphohydrolase MESH1 n=1 Tax=Menopon gallinae TaxID=328185 RepID=A0AAW2HLL9_9NEOP
MVSFSGNFVSEIIKCVNFAAIKHKDQRRKDSDQTPYINHPVGVAYILTHEAGVDDPAVIQAAILHDVIEDTETTYEELLANFGEEVTEIVRECTDDKSLDKMERKRLQIERAKGSSTKAKLVKLADKLYNLRDLDRCTPVGWTKQRVDEYFIWAHKVVTNLSGTNKNMEDSLAQIFREHNVI